MRSPATLLLAALTALATAQTVAVTRASLDITGIQPIPGGNRLRVDLVPAATRADPTRTGLESVFVDNMDLNALTVRVDGRPALVEPTSRLSLRADERLALILVFNLNGARFALPEMARRANRLCAALAARAHRPLCRVIAISGTNYYKVAEGREPNAVAAALRGLAKRPGPDGLLGDLPGAAARGLATPFAGAEPGAQTIPLVAVFTAAPGTPGGPVALSVFARASVAVFDFSTMESLARATRAPDGKAEEPRAGEDPAAPFSRLDPGAVSFRIDAANTADRFSEAAIQGALRRMASEYALSLSLAQPATAASHVMVVWRVPGLRRPIRADWNPPSPLPFVAGLVVIVLVGGTGVAMVSRRFRRELAPSLPDVPFDSPAAGPSGRVPTRPALAVPLAAASSHTEPAYWSIESSATGVVPVRAAVVVGRGEGEARVAGDELLSWRHARFEPTAAGRLWVKDLGSANGVAVDGERVLGGRELAVGSVVVLGQTAFTIRRGGAARG